MSYQNADLNYTGYVTRLRYLQGVDVPVTINWSMGTNTSDYQVLQRSEELLSAIMLLGLELTSAALALETVDSFRLRERSFSQMTSAAWSWTPPKLTRSRQKVSPAGTARADTLNDLRTRMNLTWDQVARLFGVSRRAVHSWASGAPMASEYEEHLYRLHGLTAELEIDSKALLFTPNHTGHCVFDLLRDRDYRMAARELVAVPAFAIKRPRPPDPSVLAERRPLSPDILLSAREDNGLPAARRVRRVQPRRRNPER
jgi:transcriptional regulator with XRE-family HTH domain